MKLRLLEIKQKYKDNKYLNDLIRKFNKHNAKRHTIDEVLFCELFNKTSKTLRVSRLINYKCNETKEKGHLNYEQIAYICNCSLEEVEYTVRKLTEANLITHTRNSKKAGRKSKDLTGHQFGD